jgi:hypothetical protein
MRGKLMFVAGAAVGFVLGSRAGRERYEELSSAAQKILSNPSVQEAGGAAKAQATKLYESGKGAFSNSKLADKIRTTTHLPTNGKNPVEDSSPQKMTTNSF